MSYKGKKKNRNFNVIILLRNHNFCSYTVTMKVQCSLLNEQPGCCNKTVETTESESPSFKKSAYYASIILDAQEHLLCSKLCQHNLSRPNGEGVSGEGGEEMRVCEGKS